MMKKQNVIFILAILFASTSCNNDHSQPAQPPVVVEKPKQELEQRYQFVEEGDTVVLILKNTDSNITGHLDFLYSEKDNRIGTISNGQMKGDTLFAMYNSMQEGEQSECEIALLKKGNNFILTNDIFGDSNYQYNVDYTKGNFKNKQLIHFDGDTLVNEESKH